MNISCANDRAFTAEGARDATRVLRSARMSVRSWRYVFSCPEFTSRIAIGEGDWEAKRIKRVKIVKFGRTQSPACCGTNSVRSICFGDWAEEISAEFSILYESVEDEKVGYCNMLGYISLYNSSHLFCSIDRNCSSIFRIPASFRLSGKAIVN
jgi:hypothetical protein